MAVQETEERLKVLMIESLSGNEQSYRRLLTDLGAHLRVYYTRRLGRGHAMVEDLVQETLLAVHVRRFTYDRDRPFTGWLNAIARYKLIDHFRASRARPTMSIDEAGDVFVEETADAAMARVDIGRLLDELPAKFSVPIRAVKIDGRSVAEVSAAEGVSQSAVKVAIHRGLKRLARRLKGPDAS